MKQLPKRLLLILFLFFSAIVSFAQEREITGTVKDNNGVPVTNASVLIKGTSKGVATNSNGAFNISVNETNTILVISSVGFETKEVAVEGNRVLNVVLEGGAGSMQEVVITALGISKQKRAAGFFYY